MAGNFSATVSDWVRETEARMTAVRNESVERLIEVMQTPVGAGGNMPVDTGFLRASLRTTIGKASFAVTTNPGKLSVAYDSGEITLVLAGAKVSDTIEAVFTANYALAAEYGGENRQGRRFVGLAVQQWPQIVREVSIEAQGRAKK
jgi:hypothetical protein